MKNLHAILAYLMMDGPGDPQFHLKVCVFVPAVSLAISWMLFRFKAAIWLLLVQAAFASLFVLSLISHPLTRGAMIEDFGIEYVIAIVASASLPLVAFVHFRSLRKKEPTQSSTAQRP